MANNILLLLGAAVIASAIFLIFQRGRRNALLEQLHVSRRRVSGAKTPPRSLSPSKKQVQPPEADYSDTFPPSRRFTLAATDVPTKLGQAPEKVIASQVDWMKNMLPLQVSYLDADESMYTPCEFSVKEIKALGDFPDYATLSGVPLPKPYAEFNIDNAMPRPYRPFRWAYHQTMCRWPRTAFLDDTHLAQLSPSWSPIGG